MAFHWSEGGRSPESYGAKPYFDLECHQLRLVNGQNLMLSGEILAVPLKFHIFSFIVMSVCMLRRVITSYIPRK